jgi:hypothetical protein
MDFKYVPYALEGKQYYQLSCVDHHSSWRLIRIYPHKDLIAVTSFLKELEALCPFTIKQLQTDNDLAFTDKYRQNTDGEPTGSHPVDLWCEKWEIEHKLIPIGKKELNGKVENTHKWDDREFFSQTPAQTLQELQQASLEYNHRWNEKRQTEALSWRSPSEVLYAYYFTRKFFNLWFAEEPKPKPPKPKLAKPELIIDRYLKYRDWESQRHPVSSTSPSSRRSQSQNHQSQNLRSFTSKLF